LKPLFGVSTIVATAGRRPVLLVGDGRVVRERVCGSERAVVREPTGEFSQANGTMNALLRAQVVDAVRAEVDAAQPLRVLELFAGSGNLTFPLLGAGCDVVAVEGASRPVAAAARAWSGIRERVGRSASFSVADLTHPLRGDALTGLGRAQVVVTDPPRGGMSAALVAQLAGCEAQRIVYVACDPPAMARDVTRLAAAGWQVSAWSALDLFARTPHLEFVVRLDRASSGALPLAGGLG
jgi:tRNA/tmRNA/rRNA uracil-C5-methylase (TrmA/RlmC/RlmD family)